MKYWAVRFQFLRSGTWRKASRLVSKDDSLPREDVEAAATSACERRGERLLEVVERPARR